MKLYFHPAAEQELLDLPKDKQKEVDARVEKLKETGTNYSNFGRLADEETGVDCYRSKIKTEEPVEVNQRMIISIFQNQFVAYGISHHDKVYSKKYLKEIKYRKY